tara:strand:- start:10 stop:342 length:333 start_codon:yes stop_codon:yes gene_type:complete
LNNSKKPSELEKFKSKWTNFWIEDDFRSQTFEQIIKDFWLSGIVLNLEDLQKHKTLEALAESIDKTIKDNPKPQLFYIVDLKEKSYENLGLAIVQRIAFKVFLRKHFSSQ